MGTARNEFKAHVKWYDPPTFPAGMKNTGNYSKLCKLVDPKWKKLLRST
jgi:hypothetical protein